MSKLILALFFAAYAAVAQPAAQRAGLAAEAPLVSPEVLPAHRVVFRLRAPKATEVTLAGDFWVKQGRSEQLSKDPQGVWTLTTEPLPSNYYSYIFTVDGVRMPDPANGMIKPGVSETQSTFFVPGSHASMLQLAAVPHGEIRTVYYPSARPNQTRRMHLYLPPGYEGGKTRFPVVYLLHGGGDDDSTWVSMGRVNFVLDNLIAQGKARPMIIVMPSLWVLDPPVRADRAAENAALFATDLFQAVIPYTEAHYRVAAGARYRAIGGLGAGREFLANLLWPHLGELNTAFFASGGADANYFTRLQQMYPGVIDDSANSRRLSFFIGGGTSDAALDSGRNLVAALKARGYAVSFAETDATHGWPEFRNSFEQFALAAFQPRQAHAMTE